MYILFVCLLVLAGCGMSLPNEHIEFTFDMHGTKCDTKSVQENHDAKKVKNDAA